MTTLLKTCGISPPAGGAAELTVSLTYLDIIWLRFHPIRRLLFYEYPCTIPDFVETIVPKLEHSLSLTLSHYLPIAGKLLYPSDTQKMPVIRYVAGDSVSLVVAESSNDFDELVGNHARDADQFYDLVPQIPAVVDDGECKIVPVFALQMTLFPGRGICVGFANHHSLGDASSIVGFMQAWASINGDDGFGLKSLPIFDRSVMKCDHQRIGSVFWKAMGRIPFTPSSFPLPTNDVRATFTLSQNDIVKLKNRVPAKNPSSFVVTTSYVWSCLAKALNAAGGEFADDIPAYFIFPVDARARLDPPVPANYFGNCLGYGIVDVDREKLVGDGGFVSAAEGTADEIKNRVNKTNELLKDPENWMKDMGKFKDARIMGVSGSPKFDLPNVDFGWGKARKLEVISIDKERYSMSLCKSMKFLGGLEIGLSLPKEIMEAFSLVFFHGLRS